MLLIWALISAKVIGKINFLNRYRLMPFKTLILFAILVNTPVYAFPKDLSVADFQAFIGNSINNLKSCSNLSVTSSNTLFIIESYNKTNEIISKISYLSAGGDYRIKYKWLEGRQPVNPEVQVSYNGNKHAEYYGGKLNQVSYSKHDSPTSLVPINPIIAPFIFLSKDDDACPVCLLRMGDVASGAAVHNLMASKITSTSEKLSGGGDVFFKVSSGDYLDGAPVYWIVGVGQFNGSYIILSADRFSDQGKSQSIYRFFNYTNISVGAATIDCPTLQTIQVIEDNKQALTGSINTLEILQNTIISSNSFDIFAELGGQATRIYNKDTGEYDRIPERHNPLNPRYAGKRDVILIVLVVISFMAVYALIPRNRRR